MKNVLNFNRTPMDVGGMKKMKSTVQNTTRWLITLIAILSLGTGQMWGVAKQRYIYVGINDNFQNNKDGSKFGLHVWGGTDGDQIISLTWITDTYNWDNKNYAIYRAYIYDDTPNTQFKAKDTWWSNTLEGISLDGTTNNAVFFADDGSGNKWQFQQNYQVSSEASLSATSTTIAVGGSSTITPSLSTNATYNEISSTSYEVTTNPNSGGSVTSGGVFSASKSGTYVVTATVTYNAKDFSGITKTTTATKTITVTAPITLNKNDGSGTSTTQNSVYGSSAATRRGSMPIRSGYGFDGYWTTADNSGVKVIKENGDWKTSISGFTDGSGNWTCTTAQTLYAHWLAEGYYLCAAFTNWEATISKFSGSPLKCSWSVADHNVYSPSFRTEFKIRKVQANTSSACNDVWYGWGQNSSQNTIGKTNTYTDLYANENNVKLEVNYDGTYEFTFTDGATPRIAVAVPVIDQLQIYKPDDALNKGNYDWTGPTSNIVTKTVTLASGTTYQFKAVYDSEFFGKGSGDSYTTIGRATDSVALGTGSSNGNNVKIDTDVKGDYQFDFHVKTNKVIVTYPTRRLVTYTIVTKNGGTGTAGSLTATNDDDNNVNISSLSNYVADGNSVSFSAPDASTGYTWRGWFSKNNPSNWADGLLEEEQDYTSVSVSGGNLTVYAIYSQDEYNATVSAGSHGDVSPKGTVAIKQVTGTELTATPTTSSQYTFKDWTIANGGIAAKSPSTLTTNPATFTATSTGGTIQANFGSKWSVVGGNSASSDGADDMGDWGVWTNQLENYASKSVSEHTEDTCLVNISLPANTDFQFKVRDNAYGSVVWYGNNNSTQYMTYASNNKQEWQFETEKANCGITTAGKGTYKFSWNTYTKKLRVTYPTSWTVTYGKKVIYNNDNATLTNATSEGSITSVVDGDEIALTSGKYVIDGGSVTVVVAPATGYEVAGWYSDAACTLAYTNGSGNVTISGDKKTFTISSIAANTGIYVKFKEIMTTVTINASHSDRGTITVAAASHTWGNTTSVGVHTTKALVATAKAGYYFSGWSLSDGADCTVTGTTEDYASTTLTGSGAGTASTLTANFLPLEKVYFRNWNEDSNSALWDKVYVYFSIGYEDHSGSCAKVNSSADFKALMKQEGTSNVYWAYVPRATTRAVNSCDDDIAFSNHDFTVNTAFFEYEGVMRGDYKAGLDMFVPTHGDAFTRNSTTYYNGFWKHHNVEAGSGAKYYMKRYKSGTDYEDASDGKGNCQFTVVDENTITYNLRIDGMTAAGNRYKIDNPKGISYITKPAGGAVISGDTVKTTHCEDLPMTEYTSSTPTFVILPSAEGMYTITIDQSGDRMKLSVDYPISAGDYILEHSYNDGSAKTSHSYIIKPRDAAGSTISMFLYGDHDKNGTIDGTLKLKKCTSTAGGTPTWSTGNAVSGYTAANFKDGSGVYQFDVVINTSTDAVTSVGTPKLYEGKYYIKTDIASGGWVNYTENELHYNDVTFNASDATTFDYYYCQWAESGRNVKCVIANDYNIQLTDTLKLDDIATDVSGEPKVSENTNVRFSYNSLTNELKRTYLASVSGTDVSKVFLKANASGYVYDLTTPDANDLYTYNSTASHFHEDGNWTYQMDVDVFPGSSAQAAVKTVYPSGGTEREFVSNTVLIGNGDKGSTKLRVRLVYDFKTNHLVAAYVPTAVVALDKTIDLHSDLIYLRAGAGESTQITFDGSSGKLTNVKKVYGAFEFKKDSMAGQMSSWTANDYRARRQCRYYFSFPFDVKVSDIFGVGVYGIEYIIQTYNGAKRAEIGWFQDTETFWETLTTDSVLHARQGYALMLDREEFNRSDNKGVWTNIPSGGSIFLYFPSTEAVNTIDGASGSFTVPAHIHTGTRVNKTTGKAHSTTDSNWNLIGLATYGDVYSNGGPTSYFKYNPVNNGWTAATVASSPQFLSMYAYMVQWAGTFSWTFTPPAGIAARKVSETKNKTIQLNLMQNDVEKSRAFVKLNEEASADFVLNEDMSAIINSGQPNIYTYAGVYDVAFNNVPNENQTINVGVVIPKAGTYTFMMPEDINGTVTLIDEFEQTRTNLSLSDYEVTLPKGTINDRFKLEINIHKIATAIDGVENGEGTLKDGKAHKFIMNDQMYILKDGVIYDARGNRVQ